MGRCDLTRSPVGCTGMAKGSGNSGLLAKAGWDDSHCAVCENKQECWDWAAASEAFQRLVLPAPHSWENVQ